MRQWRIAAAADRTAPEPFYRLSRVAARTSRCAPATPSSQTVRRRTGRACGRRPVRGVRSEEGKSGLEARQAPSLGIRHRRTGQLVTETIPPCRSNHPRRRRHRQHTRRKTRFSTPSNPGPPTRTPARWGGNREPIPDRPVSRRYVHVENALAAWRTRDAAQFPGVQPVEMTPFAGVDDEIARSTVEVTQHRTLAAWAADGAISGCLPSR